MGDRTSGGGHTISSLRLPPWVSVLAAVGILVALGLRLGAGPFVDALHSISLAAVLVAVGITAGTTWACAQRWSLLADRLDVGIPIKAAYRAYYRAQFFNATLPSGVVGEVDRAVWHGHSSRAMSRGIRSVAWDRITGQVVLLGLAVAAIPALASPLRTWMLWFLFVTAAVLLVVRAARPAFMQRAWAEARHVPGAREVWPRVFLLSTLATVGHVLVFIIAARAVGVTAPTLELVPLGLVVLQISSIPLGVAGWGPREGGAALVFGAAGLGASTGLAVSVTYGVLATLATFPGVLTLRRRRAAAPTSDPEGDASWVIAPTRS
jgi:glycosyltransferase 2 family protein